MKKYFNVVLLLLCLGLGACDGNGNGDVDPGASNLSKAANKFVGFWHTEDGSTDFLFKEDGTCKGYTYALRQDTEIGQGNWKYDETTKILTTTVGGNQWTVTLSTDLSWAGLSLGGDGAQSFSQSELWHFYANLINGRWVSNSGNILDYNSDYGLRYHEVTKDNICYEKTNDSQPAWAVATSELNNVKQKYDYFYGVENTQLKITNVNGLSANIAQTYYINYLKWNGKRYTNGYETVTFFRGTLTLSELDSDNATLKVDGTTYSGNKISEEYTLRK